jgi:hypothetical protein
LLSEPIDEIILNVVGNWYARRRGELHAEG